MKKLLLKIRKDREFGDKHCLRCEFQAGTPFGPDCVLFGRVHLAPDIKAREYLRCKECLKAEVKP